LLTFTAKKSAILLANLKIHNHKNLTMHSAGNCNDISTVGVSSQSEERASSVNRNVARLENASSSNESSQVHPGKRKGSLSPQQDLIDIITIFK
jgi:hypothetical protein